MTFPAEWRLTRNETAILYRLVNSKHPVPDADIRAIAAPTGRTVAAKRPNYRGKQPRILIYELRRKLAPHGIEINNTRDRGYWLPQSSKALIGSLASYRDHVESVAESEAERQSILSAG